MSPTLSEYTAYIICILTVRWQKGRLLLSGMSHLTELLKAVITLGENELLIRLSNILKKQKDVFMHQAAHWNFKNSLKW